MPIRLNLLAEAQAAEELRRKDPVKRAIQFGAGCVAILIAISLVFASQVVSANRTAEGISSRIRYITNQYSAVIVRNDRLHQVNLNIRGLDIFAAERFLNGNLLNALQKVSADNVQLIRLRAQHTYSVADEVRSKTEAKKVTKPATAAESIVLTLEARDSSPSAGDQVTKFKDALAKSAYFVDLLGTNNEMRLVNLAPPQLNLELGRQVVQFTLESRPPEKVRLEIASPVRYAPAKTATKEPGRKPQSGPVESDL